MAHGTRLATGLEGAGGALRRAPVKDLAGAQLFNLAEDVGETTNLAEQHPDKVAQLSTAWHEWNKGNIDPLWIPAAGARRNNREQRRAAREAAIP